MQQICKKKTSIIKTSILAFITLLFLSFNSYAGVMVLDFEGLDDQESINDFYNGGTSENGNSGTDYGVSFSGNTLSIIDLDAGGTGNFGGEPTPDTVMFFLTGASAIMNVAEGFDTGFSFFYSAINNSGSVSVYDGLDGTGNLLAVLDIPTTPSDGGDPNGNFSPFYAIGIEFEGLAMSVSFAGVQNQIAFDDITFGSVIPGEGTSIPIEVPEPESITLFALGIALLLRSSKKKALKIVHKETC